MGKYTVEIEHVGARPRTSVEVQADSFKQALITGRLRARLAQEEHGGEWFLYVLCVETRKVGSWFLDSEGWFTEQGIDAARARQEEEGYRMGRYAARLKQFPYGKEIQSEGVHASWEEAVSESKAAGARAQKSSGGEWVLEVVALEGPPHRSASFMLDASGQWSKHEGTPQQPSKWSRAQMRGLLVEATEDVRGLTDKNNRLQAELEEVRRERDQIREQHERFSDTLLSMTSAFHGAVAERDALQARLDTVGLEHELYYAQVVAKAQKIEADLGRVRDWIGEREFQKALKGGDGD